jgi:DNA-binding CsgD family transcriptional regulator
MEKDASTAHIPADTVDRPVRARDRDMATASALSQAAIDPAATAAFQKAVGRLTDTAQIGRLFADVIAPFGFTASAGGAFVTSRLGAASIFYFQMWPPAWLQLYQRENFVNHDFLVAEARSCMVPFTWREAKERRVLTLGEKRVWQAVLDFGWREGLGIPIHGPRGYLGLIVIASEATDIPLPLRHHLTMLALLAHERCRFLTPEAAPPGMPANLTSREIECLRFVAGGLSDVETAKQLGLSVTTVKEYVDAVRTKLGARSRSQAVAILAAAGML